AAAAGRATPALGPIPSDLAAPTAAPRNRMERNLLHVSGIRSRPGGVLRRGAARTEHAERPLPRPGHWHGREPPHGDLAIPLRPRAGPGVGRLRPTGRGGVPARRLGGPEPPGPRARGRRHAGEFHGAPRRRPAAGRARPRAARPRADDAHLL